MNKNASITGPTILWEKIKGKEVKTNEGENLGKIEKISENHFMIEEGFTKKKRFWIPKFLADIYDGKFLWLDIKLAEIKHRYYYDDEPGKSQYDMDLTEYNTKYDKTKNHTSKKTIKIKEGLELESKSRHKYKNIRDLK